MSYKKSREWFPFYVDDYLAETSRFNAQQHGIYLLLMLEYWRENGPIRNDETELCEIAKIDQKTMQKLMPPVLKKFDVEGEYLRHSYMDAELSKYHNLQEKRRKGGRLSADKRWGKPSNNVEPSLVPIKKGMDASR